MKILFVGVFNSKSTNFAQRNSLQKLCNVVCYSYRDKQMLYGKEKRDTDLVETCKREMPDFVLISKGNGINVNVIYELNKFTKTILWFMDAPIPSNYNAELEEKIKNCHYVFCDKISVIELAKKLNNNVYHLVEGFDSLTHYPIEINQDLDVSFIGTLHSDRKQFINENIKVFNNSFGIGHSEIVSRSKINLNFCTLQTASDRIYKILASKGFLLTNDWISRNEIFEDKKDLVIFKDKQDLYEKIDYYLNHDKQRNEIRENGYKTVQQFSVDNWALNLIKIITSN